MPETADTESVDTDKACPKHGAVWHRNSSLMRLGKVSASCWRLAEDAGVGVCGSAAAHLPCWDYHPFFPLQSAFKKDRKQKAGWESRWLFWVFSRSVQKATKGRVQLFSTDAAQCFSKLRGKMCPSLDEISVTSHHQHHCRMQHTGNQHGCIRTGKMDKIGCTSNKKQASKARKGRHNNGLWGQLCQLAWKYCLPHLRFGLLKLQLLSCSFLR